MNTQGPSATGYDLASVQLPHLTGWRLRAFVRALECAPLRGLLAPLLLRQAGLQRFRALTLAEPPTFYPLHPAPGGAAEPDARLDPAQALAREPSPTPGFAFPRARDYAQAYREGRATPEAVAERVIAALEADARAEPPLAAIIRCESGELRAQARDSAGRYRAGAPLGPLDGVPVAVKDEVDQRGYPTTVGTRFWGARAAEHDSAVVERLRAAGALLIGKANMHEIGIVPTGLNPHHGCARNPYDPACYTGGSSSGSAAAVAAGLCPLALGADGGGSIRIPASLCGLVGLKPTFGRISEHGAAPINWTVAHLGPLAGTVEDCALGYALWAGPDPRDPRSLGQAPPRVTGWDDLDLGGLRLGVYEPWFRHAQSEVVTACEALLARLEARGARIVPVEIPGLDAARVAHVIAIASEMAAGTDDVYAEHRRDFGLDVRINLALVRSFTARDYLRAQRLRTRMLRVLSERFQEVDAIVTPATALTAPRIPPAALDGGESNIGLITELLRFAFLANLTGLPAIAFPAGYDSRGLPIGFQALGGPWNELLLLRLAAAAEREVERRAPRRWTDLL